MTLDRAPGKADLYIGGIISMRRREALKAANITHVVSALRQPLDLPLYAPYRHLVVEVDDDDDEDLLQHFPESNAFIQQGADGGGGVLVHCVMGKSRSSALVLAYMLSADASLTPASALEQLRTAREMAEPNPGFMKQLELYHAMGCPADVAAQPAYQRWLYQREVEMSLACGRAPDAIRFEDEVAGDSSATQGLEVRCRKCRRALATDQYVVQHAPRGSDAAAAAAQPATGPIGSVQAGPPAAAGASACAHIFLDPLSWMRPELEQGKMDGRLECPNERCRSVVGKYAWQGMRCSCGQWVVPALSLARGRVDEVRKRAPPPPAGKM